MQITMEQARSLGIKLPTVSKPRRVKKPPPPDSYISHDCAILAIDPGKTSGYALHVPGRLALSGKTTSPEMCRVIVETARDAASAVKRPLIVVAETWTTGDRIHDRRMRAATLLGLGAAWQSWYSALAETGLPKSRIVRVNVATWRSKVIGGPMNRSSEEWKRLAAIHAEQRFPRRTTPIEGRENVGDDEAEALCILAWALRAGAVGEALKKAGKRYP